MRQQTKSCVLLPVVAILDICHALLVLVGLTEYTPVWAAPLVLDRFRVVGLRSIDLFSDALPLIFDGTVHKSLRLGSSLLTVLRAVVCDLVVAATPGFGAHVFVDVVGVVSIAVVVGGVSVVGSVVGSVGSGLGSVGSVIDVVVELIVVVVDVGGGNLLTAVVTTVVGAVAVVEVVIVEFVVVFVVTVVFVAAVVGHVSAS